MVNMAFNLGETGLKSFQVLGDILRKDEVTTKDWEIAACDIAISCWYCQVKCRAVRLITRMLNQTKDSDGSMSCQINDGCLQLSVTKLTNFTFDSCCFVQGDESCFNDNYIGQDPKCHEDVYKKTCCIH